MGPANGGLPSADKQHTQSDISKHLLEAVNSSHRAIICGHCLNLGHTDCVTVCVIMGTARMHDENKNSGSKSWDATAARAQLWRLLAPESSFFSVIAVYGIAISLLTLAVPIAVQTLINSIANIGALRGIYTLATALLLILLSYGALSALRVWMAELYRRRVFARLAGELSYSVIRAPAWFFEGGRNGGLTHRFFDIMTLQKNVPRLLTDGFALVLQMAVGFTLVSFYHPALFLFNVLVVSTVVLIWKLWSRGARQRAVELSREKYAMARWLGDMEVAHEFFKSGRQVDLAADKTRAATDRYLVAHQNLFKFTFNQTVGFLILYAVGSSALLGLGGFLVVRGELSIGQLVAAELVMASIFVGLSRFSSYLKDYYELYGAADKIAEALSIPEEPSGNNQLVPRRGSLRFDGVVLTRNSHSCQVDTVLEVGEKVLIRANEAWIQRAVLGALRGHGHPVAGRISLDGVSLSDLDIDELRHSIQGIDRAPVLSCSIREYLALQAPEADAEAMMQALKSLSLDRLVADFPQGLDTQLAPNGMPLQGAEMLLLKLAGALLAQPAILVLNQLFDQITPAVREDVLRVLSGQDFMVVYFSSLPATPPFTRQLDLVAQEVTERG